MRACILALALLGASGCTSESSDHAASQSQAAPAVTQQRLRGVVRDQDGEPLGDAFVIVAEDATELVPEGIDPGQLFTDAEGRYAIDLAPGRYRVQAVALGVTTPTHEVEVGLAGAALDLTVTRDEAAVVDLVERAVGLTEPAEGDAGGAR